VQFNVKKETTMKINLLIFIISVKEQNENGIQEAMMKTIESTIRPVKGDIIDDPGFDPGFHNGYEVVKVTINYASNECFVSLRPLVLEEEEIKIETYIEKLEAHGWRIVSKEALENR
jgi:hypothetical protein